MDDPGLEARIGSERSEEAILDLGPAGRLAAAIEAVAPGPGEKLPLAWHWLYFLGAPPAGQVSRDGRGSAADLLPPFEGLSRMWAGGAFRRHGDLRMGDRATRRTRVASLARKAGRSGPLILASLDHRLAGASGEAIHERQDIVFRSAGPYAGAPAGERARQAAQWRRRLVPDEVLLFRFSALTYNAHRIHYDWPYTTRVEGYPGLLVHGPLTCILLLDLVARSLPGRELASFDYRAVRPLFCGRAMELCGGLGPDGRTVEVWAEDHEGCLAMTGRGELAQ